MTKFAPELSINTVSRRLLVAYLSNPSHALILVGETGRGVTTIALELAKSLNNRRTPILLEPVDGKDIAIDAIRELYVSTHSINEQAQVVIIDNSDKMSFPAQNAFLKLLEEPPEKVYFILVVHNPYHLLPTIKSRSETIEIKPINKLDSQQIINHQTNDLTMQKQIMFLASGRPALISRLINNVDYFNQRHDTVKQTRNFLEQSIFYRLCIINEIKDRESAVDFLEMAGSLLRFSLNKSFDPRLGYQLRVIANAIDSAKDNSNIKLTLISVALTL